MDPELLAQIRAMMAQQDATRVAPPGPEGPGFFDQLKAGLVEPHPSGQGFQPGPGLRTFFNEVANTVDPRRGKGILGFGADVLRDIQNNPIQALTPAGDVEAIQEGERLYQEGHPILGTGLQALGTIGLASTFLPIAGPIVQQIERRAVRAAREFLPLGIPLDIAREVGPAIRGATAGAEAVPGGTQRVQARHFGQGAREDMLLVEQQFTGRPGTEAANPGQQPRTYFYLPEVIEAQTGRPFQPEPQFRGDPSVDVELDVGKFVNNEGIPTYYDQARETLRARKAAGPNPNINPEPMAADVQNLAEEMMIADGAEGVMDVERGVIAKFTDTTLPRGATGNGVQRVASQATEYVERARGLGRQLDPHPQEFEYLPLPENEARNLADMYDELPHAPNDPQVQASYRAMADETKDQYQYLQEKGVQFEAAIDDPYASSNAMIRDVRENNRLKFFLTDLDDFPADHPLAAPSGVFMTMPDGTQREMVYNDLFRAVHDYFGHASEGFQFGPRGEHNAWGLHSVMYSPLARGAMSFETRGQNSWVNFGQQLRRSDGSLPSRGDPDFIPPEKRDFAAQKANVLPDPLTSPTSGSSRFGDPADSASRLADGRIVTAPRQAGGMERFPGAGGTARAVSEPGTTTRSALEQEFIQFESPEALDEFYGIDVEDIGGGAQESQFRDSGYSGTQCTGYACAIRDKLGEGRVRVRGFFQGDNPGTIFGGRDPQFDPVADGHDFAVVDDRYIVDPWVTEFVGGIDQGVYDLLDPADRDMISRIYGDPEKWSGLAGLEVPPAQLLPSPDELFSRGTQSADEFLGDLAGGAHRTLPNRPATAVQAARDRLKFDNKNKANRAARREAIESGLTPEELEYLSGADKGVNKNVEVAYSKLPTPETFAHAAIRGQAARGWYEGSGRALREAFGDDAPRFTALLAAQSPQKTVEENLRIALNSWGEWLNAGRPTDPDVIRGLMHTNLEADLGNSVRALTMDADVARRGDPAMLNGPKVGPFYSNLLGRVEPVVNDTHMARGYGTKKEGVGTVARTLAQNAMVRNAAVEFARLTGTAVTPRELQEMSWAYIRGLTNAAGAKGSALEAIEESFLNPGAKLAQGVTLTERIEDSASIGHLMAQPEFAEAVARAQANVPNAYSPKGVEGLDPGSADINALRDIAERIDLVRQGKPLYSVAPIAGLLGVTSASQRLRERQRERR